METKLNTPNLGDCKPSFAEQKKEIFDSSNRYPPFGYVKPRMWQLCKNAESKGAGIVVDWNTELSPDGIITEDRWNRLERSAANWISCACGNQCSVIPRDYMGAPLDGDLRLLGSKFYEAIMLKNVLLARRILSSIERRSAKLISDIYIKQQRDGKDKHEA